MRPAWLVLVAALAGGGCGRVSASGPSPTDGAAQPLPAIALGVSAKESVPEWAPFSIVRRDADDLSWVDEVLAQGRTPIILVSYGDKATIPARVAEAFERYPQAWIEVWNEPNDAAFWGEAPDPEAYVRMFAAARAAAPGARLLGPSTGGGAMDWAFMERCARAGLGRYLTAASIHPYGVGHPDHLPAAAARVRALFGAPVVITEWGFDAGGAQADLVSAAVRAAARADVGFVVLYSWVDRSPGPPQGLANSDGTPRPALERLMGRLTHDLLAMSGVVIVQAPPGAFVLEHDENEDPIRCQPAGKPGTFFVSKRFYRVAWPDVPLNR